MRKICLNSFEIINKSQKVDKYEKQPTIADSPVLAILLFVTGFTSGCVVISFAFARESVPARLAGTVIGLTNMGFMLGPMLLQPAVGWMLDRNWGGVWSNGVKIYSLSAYRTGFILMIVWALLALGLLFFTRETYCRPNALVDNHTPSP